MISFIFKVYLQVKQNCQTKSDQSNQELQKAIKANKGIWKGCLTPSTGLKFFQSV
jgi:endonuclease YncB( thermonuclease family)